MGCSASVSSSSSESYPPSESGPPPLTEEDIKSRIESPSCVATLKISTDVCRYTIKHAYLSQRGYYPNSLNKANQDAFIVEHELNNWKNCALWGVFDGHGQAGDLVSHYANEAVRDNLIQEINKVCANNGSSNSAKDVFAISDEDMLGACHRTFVRTNEECKGKKFDSELSGTTAITVFIRGHTMYISNVGDSRAIVAVTPQTSSPLQSPTPTNYNNTNNNNYQNTRLKAEHLSIDQTPFRKDERDRVKACGATVMTIDQIEGLEPIHENWGLNLGEEVDENGDPPRVWSSTLDRPGCAFTRSIGDGVAEVLGVFAEPEQLCREIDETTKFVIIASDGVWEFLTSQSVVDMVANFTGDDAPLEACKSVVAESYRLWLQYEVRTDDITMIVLRFDDFERGTDHTSSNHDAKSETEGASNRSLGRGGVRRTTSGTLDAQTLKQRPVRRQMSKAKRKIINEHTSSTMNTITEKFKLEDHIQPKTIEEANRIHKQIETNFLFHHMTTNQKDDCVSCMEKIHVTKGEVVIKEGDEGEKFYIVDFGTYDVSVRDVDGVDTVVLTYSDSGSVFGELSLMYGKPRAATITATSNGQLWAIDRATFRASMVKRNSHTDLIAILRKVNILNTLTMPQMQRLCDCLKEEEVEKGAYIVKQGDSDNNNMFYIVEEGSIVATTTSPSSGEETEVLKLEKSDYFGERSLMYNEPTLQNIKALTHCRLLTISRSAFEEVIGTLASIIEADTVKNQEKKTQKEKLTNYKKFNSMKDLALTPILADRTKFKYKRIVSNTDAGFFGTGVNMSAKNPTVCGVQVISKRYALTNKTAHRHASERTIFKEFVKRSPFVPDFLTSFQSDTCCYLLFKSTFTTDLAYFMGDSKSPILEDDVKFYLSCIISALEFLECEGFMYRMLNPTAIMINNKGYPILTDMRYTKKMTGQKVFTICGEHTYMAPEMIVGKGYDFSVDSWSLGVLAGEMLTGVNMFESEEGASETKAYNLICLHKYGDFGSSVMGSKFSEGCRNVVDGLLNPDALQRLGGGGASDIFKDAWFQSIDVEKLLCQELPSPHIKELTALIDTEIGEHEDDEDGGVDGEFGHLHVNDRQMRKDVAAVEKGGEEVQGEEDAIFDDF